MMFGQLEVFLAENVRGLTTEPHKKDFHEAIQILQEAGYAFNSVGSQRCQFVIAQIIKL